MDEFLRRYGYLLATCIGILAVADAALLVLHPAWWGRLVISVITVPLLWIAITWWLRRMRN